MFIASMVIVNEYDILSIHWYRKQGWEVGGGGGGGGGGGFFMVIANQFAHTIIWKIFVLKIFSVLTLPLASRPYGGSLTPCSYVLIIIIAN